MLNCRRISGLLSAFLDGELTGEEMLAIREHLDICGACAREHQSLRETKLLLASLVYKAPRAELEALLVRHGIEGAAGVRRLPEPSAGGLRPFPIAATLFFSLAGLWLASTALNAPGDAIGDAVDHIRPVYPVLAIGGGYQSPVALDVPPSPPVEWSFVPVLNSESIAPYAPASPADGYSPIGAPLVINAAIEPARSFSTYSVTTISDGHAQTVRFFSTAGGPSVTNSNGDRRLQAGHLPLQRLPHPVMFGIGPDGTIVGVRPPNR